MHSRNQLTMVPTMKWKIIVMLIGAANAGSAMEYILTPNSGNVEGVEVQCGDQCQTDSSNDQWYLHGQKSSVFDDWALELDLSGPLAVSSGSTITFEIDGSKVVSDSNQWGEGDMFMGFGDGEKYIAFGLDFDGALGNWAGKNSPDNINGMLIYPPCSGDHSLATGSVSDLLQDVGSHLNPWGKYDARYAVRDLLAGGDRSDWGLLSGESISNGDNWPVTIEIMMGADEVTFRFISASVKAKCTYSDTFADGEFVFGMLGEPENGDKDNFYIHSVGVSVSTNDVALSFDDIVISSSPMSWTNANKWCGEQGLELASIHSEADNDVVYKACKASPGSFAWIGLNVIGDSHSVDNFVWSDGSAVDFTNWGGNQPDDQNGNNDCVRTYCGGGGGQGKWLDDPCGWGQPYAICAPPSQSASTDASGNAAAAHSMHSEDVSRSVDDFAVITLGAAAGVAMVAVVVAVIMVMRTRKKGLDNGKEQEVAMSEVVTAPKEAAQSMDGVDTM